MWMINYSVCGIVSQGHRPVCTGGLWRSGALGLFAKQQTDLKEFFSSTAIFHLTQITVVYLLNNSNPNKPGNNVIDFIVCEVSNKPTILHNLKCGCISLIPAATVCG